VTAAALPRSERARGIASWIVGRIQDAAPEGVFRWAHAWERVAAADAECLAALTAWENAGAGSPAEAELQAAVQAGAGRLVEAWREAAAEWEAGRPVPASGAPDR
jgi:hypothetical protein